MLDTEGNVRDRKPTRYISPIALVTAKRTDAIFHFERKLTAKAGALACPHDRIRIVP
jgi:hypothetical protein